MSHALRSFLQEEEACADAPLPPQTGGPTQSLAVGQTEAALQDVANQVGNALQEAATGPSPTPKDVSDASPVQRWAAAAVRRKVPRMPLLTKSAWQSRKRREKENLLIQRGRNPFADSQRVAADPYDESPSLSQQLGQKRAPMLLSPALSARLGAKPTNKRERHLTQNGPGF